MHFYKLKKFLRLFKYWYRQREMVFVLDDEMYRFSYVLAFHYVKLLKILKYHHFENAESLIASKINSCNLEETLNNKCLFENKFFINDDNQKPLVEIRGQRFSKISKTQHLDFLTNDAKRINPYIYYDKGVMKENEILDILKTISFEAQYYSLNDFSKSKRGIELLFPKAEVCFLQA